MDSIGGDSIVDKEEKNKNDAPEDQFKREIGEKSRLQLNGSDKGSSIQLSILLKRSCQERLADPTWGSQQSTCIKDKMTTTANFMCSVSTTPSVSKSRIQMVTVLANLNPGYDDSGPDESLSLKETVASPY